MTPETLTRATRTSVATPIVCDVDDGEGGNENTYAEEVSEWWRPTAPLDAPVTGHAGAQVDRILELAFAVYRELSDQDIEDVEDAALDRTHWQPFDGEAAEDR